MLAVIFPFLIGGDATQDTFAHCDCVLDWTFLFNFVAVAPEETSKDELEKLMLGLLTDITFLEENGTLAECTAHRVCNLNKYAATAPEPQSTLIPLLRYKRRRLHNPGFSSLVAYSNIL
jgi:hypothetical protein